MKAPKLNYFPFLRRFLDMEVQRKVMVLQQRVKELENENSVLRQRLSDALSGKVIKKYIFEYKCVYIYLYFVSQEKVTCLLGN